MLRPKKSSRKYPYIGLGVLTVLLIGLVLELTDTTHYFRKEKAKPVDVTASAETKGETKNSSNNNTTPSSDTPDDKGQATSTPASSALVLAPSGTFASNHRASLSANYVQSSSCTTTPGASCQINFLRNGVTKSLPAETTDKGGSAYWTWQPQSVGLTEGTWQIQAVATLGSQAKSTFENPNLEILP